MKLEDLKRLCEEATPGPWGLTSPGSYIVICPVVYSYRDDDNPYARNGADRAFIAAARTMLPRLIAVAEAARVLSPIVCRDTPEWWALEKSIAALEADT